MTILAQQRSLATWGISLVAVLFGLMTLKEGGAVLFGSEEARAAAGNYVPFVLWFNFLSGFAYVIAGIGLWMQQRWAVWLAVAIVVAIAVTFAAFGIHIYSGGAFEQRTVIAMNMRTLVWVAISFIAVRSLRRQ
jgi:uncharacterized membrane protein (DUF2068 family)